jgi:hypothetical protein
MTLSEVKTALEMNKLVHDECKDVPHDIGLRLLDIVKKNLEFGCPKDRISNITASEEMEKFLDDLDYLCFSYNYEIWPTEIAGAVMKDGSSPTFTIHGRDGYKISLIYVDGDGRGE